MYQLVIWQECSKSGQKGHISFTTKQDFIPKVGELFSAPPLSGHVVGVTHDLHEQDFNLSKFIHFVQLEKKSLELADAFSFQHNLNLLSINFL